MRCHHVTIWLWARRPAIFMQRVRCWRQHGSAMTGVQQHIYLGKASAAARTAYLHELGLVQRFQALEPRDRAAVQQGWPQVGMSAEALLCV
jgi:hypothetical protein